jgi:hypothetical protein
MITCATVNDSQIDSLLEDLENISRLPMPAGCAWSGPFAVLAFDRSSAPAGSPTLSLSFAEHDLFDFENLFDASAGYSVMTPPTAEYQQQVSGNITQSETASEDPPLRLSEFPLGYSNDFEGLSFSVVRTLLNHYQQSVVELYTPALPTSESPWKTLYLPKVMGCIGEIMLIGNGPHVMICLLFSILATSAYGMQVHGEQESAQNIAWQELGKTFAIKAKSRLKLALAQISMCAFTTMKYKDYLMALLSMVTIGVCFLFHHGRARADDNTGLQRRHERGALLSSRCTAFCFTIWSRAERQITQSSYVAQHIPLPSRARGEYGYTITRRSVPEATRRVS